MRTLKSIGIVAISSVVLLLRHTAHGQTQLILNGGFESGSGTSIPNWSVNGGAALNGAAGSSQYAHGGSHYLILGGAANEIDYAFQTITIPNNATSVTLSFWENITTHETTTTSAFDKMSVTIQTTGSAVLKTVANYSNLNKDSALGIWHQVTSDLTSYKGQTINVYFASTNDSSLTTSFEIDDVSVLATVTAAAPTISSVSPTSLPSDNNLHVFKVFGNNFDLTSSHLIFTDPSNNQYSSANHSSYENRVSSTEFDYQINDGTTPGTWTVKVQNPDGQTSSGATFSVSAAPTISSVSPTSLPADNNLHVFKVFGNNFDLTSSHLIFTDPSNNQYSSANHSSYENRVSSSEFDYQINDAATVGTWTVSVQNPDGQSSGTASFSVSSVASPPSITSVNPNPVIGANGKQIVTVNGNNFVSPPKVTLTWNVPPAPPSGGYVVPAGQVTFVSATEIQMNIDTTTSPDTWTVQVTNPDSQSSSQFSFSVQAPTTGNPASVLLGIDVSHHQNDAHGSGNPINWNTIKASGRSFVLVKASEGNDIADGRTSDHTAENVAGARNAQMLVGVFHLAGNSIDDGENNSATSEAIYFLSRASAYIGNHYLPPCLDVEDNFMKVNSDPVTWIRTWLQYVQNHTVTSEFPSGIKPTLYCSRSTLQTLQNAAPDLGNYSQWIADWDNSSSTTPSYNGSSWPGWKFKQYNSPDSPTFGASSTCPGIGSVDLDSFDGTLIDLNNMVPKGVSGGGASPPTVSTPTVSGNTVAISTPTEAGFNYVLEFKNSMSDAVWIPCQTNSGNGGTVGLTDPGVIGPCRFYHIRVQ